jgi:uncharacterized protein (TIRG00374 family)
LTALIIFVILHVSEVKRFAVLVEGAEPAWLILAVILQIATYMCAAGVWSQVIRSAEHHIPLKKLARFSVEKLSINQLVPTVGIAGNVVVFQAMRLFGLPVSLAAETLLIDTLSNYIAYATMALAAFGVLWLYHNATTLVLSSMLVFVIILLTVPSLILLTLRHKDTRLPGPLKRFRAVTQIKEIIKYISPRRVLSPKLLTKAALLNALIFLLDAVTLWTIMLAIGAPIGILTAFTALIIASIAGTVSFLPGGIGSFEAGCIAVLAILGVPVEAALAGTLLLRGLTLWLPLIPGLLMARRDVIIKL